MSNKSVVINYKESTIFASNDDPDKGYVQFVKSGDQVFITVDGKSVGFVPAIEFDSVSKLIDDPSSEMREYALRHGFGR